MEHRESDSGVSWAEWLAGEPCELSDDEYAAFVSASPQGSVYVQRWWLDAVAPGCYRILALRSGSAVVAAWPLVHEPAGESRAFVTPRLTQTLGILFRPPQRKYAEELSFQHKAVADLLERLPPFASFYQKFHATFDNWMPFYWEGFDQTTLYTYVIPDMGDLGAVWSGLRSHIRQNIRKAEKAGLEVTADGTPEELYRLVATTFERQDMSAPVSTGFFRGLDQAVTENAGRVLLIARDRDGTAHAGVYIVLNGGVAYYLMGGADAYGRQHGAHVACLWRGIAFAAERAGRFDFEGSMLRQVEHVFRGFGARQTPYSAIRRTTTEPWLSWTALGRAAVAKLRRMPSRALRAAGRRS